MNAVQLRYLLIKGHLRNQLFRAHHCLGRRDGLSLQRAGTGHTGGR
jgi:hypothetical protein